MDLILVEVGFEISYKSIVRNLRTVVFDSDEFFIVMTFGENFSKVRKTK